MRKSASGFTIVELIIVVSVVGILAAIVIVAYNGVQTNARNASRITELKNWQKSFAQYKATNGSYPSMANGGYCLGTNFPDQKCRDYQSESNVYTEAGSTALMTALATYDPPHSDERVGVDGTVGPYAEYSSTTINLTAVLKGSAADCPDGTASAGVSGNRVLCRISLTK